MIIFENGWNTTALQPLTQKRIKTAAWADQNVATAIINAVANDLVRTGGNYGWSQTFANAVLCPPDRNTDLDAHVEKGLHQEEGSVFDAAVHFTVRCVRKAFHLYVIAADPALGSTSYTLKASSLSFIDGGQRFEENLNVAGVPSVPVRGK